MHEFSKYIIKNNKKDTVTLLFNKAMVTMVTMVPCLDHR